MRKNWWEMLKNSCQCYDLLTCLKLIPEMDSFEWRTNCTMTTSLVRSLLFAKREAEVPKILFYVHPQCGVSRSPSVSHSHSIHICPVRGTLGFSILNHFIIGFFLGHSVCINQQSLDQERSKQSLPKFATALSTIEISPSNFRPTSFFMASVD